jgi:hypothetical protein
VNGATKASYCPFNRLIPAILAFHSALIVRFSPAAFERVRQWPMRFTGPSAIGDSHLGRVGLDLMPHALHHTINRTRAAAGLPSVIGEPGSDFT